MKYFPLVITFLVLSLLANPASGLTMSVQESGSSGTVKVTLDKPAYVIFRMNNGTPVYTYGQTVYFTPKIPGTLFIEAISGDERATDYITISKSGKPRSYTPSPDILPSGVFSKSAYNTGKTYTFNWRTALGALEKASRMKGFSYKIKETSWGPFVECIDYSGKEVCAGDEVSTSGWMYWVNYPSDPLPGVSANEYSIKEGDVVTWYFSRNMSETPDTSPYKITISIGNGFYIQSIDVMWSGKGSPISKKSIYQPEQKVRQSLTFSREIVAYPAVQTIVELPDNISSRTNITDLKLKALGPTSKLVRVNLSAVNLTGKPFYGRDIYSSFDLNLSDRNVTLEINFRISKEWLRERNATPDLVTLSRYESRWEDIPVELTGEDWNYYYFKAEIDSFSLFAITVKWNGFPLSPDDDRIVKALNWLKTIQNYDGGFANPGEESEIGKTAWAVMAIVSAGQDPHDWKKGGKSPIDYMRETLNESLGKMGTADYARTILALISAGENPRNFSGVDLVDILKSKVRPDGQIGDFIYTTIWGILALNASGENVTNSVEWLIDHQNDDGGFAWAVGEKSDYDDTAAAIQALISAGVSAESPVIQDALAYLKTGQNEDGGFRYFGTSASNSASDSWIIQALVSAGQNPLSWKKNGISVVDHLISLQTSEGYFKYTTYQTSNPGYMTVSAIMALLGKPHPIKPLTGNVSISNQSMNTTSSTQESNETPGESKVIETPPEKPAPTPTPEETPLTTPEKINTPLAEKTITPETTPEKTQTQEEPARKVPSPGIFAGIFALIVALRLRGRV